MTDEVQEFEKKLREKYQAISVDLSKSKFHPYMTIHRIVVRKDLRGVGFGTHVMKEIIAFADEHRLKVALTPTKDFGAYSIMRLQRFYRRFGFVNNQGMHKDFSIRESMIRIPRGKDGRFIKFYEFEGDEWKEKLELADKVVATVRHRTDGTKNLINVVGHVVLNDKEKREIFFRYEGINYTVPYNELTRYA